MSNQDNQEKEDQEKKFDPSDLHCRAFFIDGKCPKRRWKSGYCPLNIFDGKYRYKCAHFCCMEKEK
jgi:hypothetical protein